MGLGAGVCYMLLFSTHVTVLPTLWRLFYYRLHHHTNNKTFFWNYGYFGWCDMSVGFYVPWGDDRLSRGIVPVPRSEFGLAPTTYFVDTQIYF